MDGRVDNPDLAQLTESMFLICVVTYQLFVQLSNCQEDNDKMLLNICNIARAKYEKPVPVNIEIPSAADVVIVLKTLLAQK